MDDNDFQSIHGRRGLNTNMSNQTFSLLGIMVIQVYLLGIMYGYDDYACNTGYAT